VRVWQYPIRGQYGKVVKVGLMEYDVEVDGKVYPRIDYRRVVKMPAANACTSTNSVVRNAMAARNAAPKGLTPTTKLRLKEDFSDEYGSYRKGDVFQMYAMGGINPRFGTMMVPGRGVTLQIPWEKLEVVNAVARRVARNADYVWSVGQSKMVFPEGMTQKVKGKILRIREAAYGDTKYLYVEYTDPRDGTKYSGWFNDQTDRPAHAREMNEGRFV
jgi:hypothetical protein